MSQKRKPKDGPEVGSKKKATRVENGSITESAFREEVINKLKNNSFLDDKEKFWLFKQLIGANTSTEDSTLSTSTEESPLRNSERKKIKVLNKREQTEEEIASTNIGLLEEMKILYFSRKVDSSKAFQLMNQSFQQRRQLILEGQLMVAQIRELYPLLFSFEEVKNELDRIFKAEKSTLFMSNVAKYCNAILKPTSKLDSLKKKVSDIANCAETAEQKRIVFETGSLLLLPQFLGEPPSFFKINQEISLESYFPHIEFPSTCTELHDALVTDGAFKIIVEGTVACKCSTLAEAVLGMVATHFIFNICYPDKCNATFVLLEKLYLESNDTEIVPECTTQIIKFLTHSSRN